MVAAIGLDDLRCLRTFRGSVNADKFLEFLQHDLLPILQPYNGSNKNSVLVMGEKNLGVEQMYHHEYYHRFDVFFVKQ